MRTLFLALLLPLAACSGGGDGNNSSDAAGDESAQGNAGGPPVPRPTGPAPRTPVLNVQDAASNDSEWLDPQPAPRDPKTAPYGNLLDQPLVDAPPQR